MRKRKSQKNAAVTNNFTPTESLPMENAAAERSNHDRPKEGPGSKG